MGDLCTADQVKAWTKISSPADDATLVALVSAVSASVESMLDRTFAATAYTETRNGTGKTRMMVRNAPLISVASVTIDGMAVQPRTTPMGAGYVFDEDTIYLAGGCFPSCFHRGAQNVVLSYTGGFEVIPLDLAQATAEWVAYTYKERDRIGFSSQVLAGQTTSYLKDLPPHLTRRFQQFARVKTVPV